MTLSDYIIIITVLLVIILAGLYFWNRKNMSKMYEAQGFIEQYKTLAQIFIIDKKIERPTAANLTKAVFENIPKSGRLRKMPMVKAKVGPQIVTLLCDKSVYEILPVKKTIKVELAGLYIVSVPGMNLAKKKKKTFSEKMKVQMDQANQKK